MSFSVSANSSGRGSMALRAIAPPQRDDRSSVELEREAIAQIRGSNRSHSASSGFTVLMLVMILGLGATLRFVGLAETGIRFDDEGCYVAEAQLWHRCGLVLLDGQARHAALTRDKPLLKSRMNGLGVDFSRRYVKPSQGFTLLGAGMMFLMGEEPSTLLQLNAIAGVCSILLLFAIAHRWFGRTVAILSALLLAISPYHIVYCRSALVEPVAIFFVLLGLWSWGKSLNTTKSRWLILSGAALSWAVTVHYRCAIFLPLVCLFQILASRPQESLEPVRVRSTISRINRLLLGFLIPPIAIEALFLAPRIAAWKSQSHLPWRTFFEGAWYFRQHVLRGNIGVESGWFVDPTILVSYASFFSAWQGTFGLGLAIIGLLIVLMRRREGRWPALIIVAMLGILCCQRYAVSRALSLLLPFLAICMAVAMDRLRYLLGRRSTWSYLLLTGLVLLVAAPATWASLQRWQVQSGIRQVCDTIVASGDRSVAVPRDANKYLVNCGPRAFHQVDEAGENEKDDESKSKKSWRREDDSFDSWAANQSRDDRKTNAAPRWASFGSLLRDHSGSREQQGAPALQLREIDVYRQRGVDPERVVDALRADGVTWVVTDAQFWHFADVEAELSAFFWWSRFVDAINHQTMLVAEFPHVSNDRLAFLAEDGSAKQLENMELAGGGTIRLYRLDAHSSGSTIASFPSSSR